MNVFIILENCEIEVWMCRCYVKWFNYFDVFILVVYIWGDEMLFRLYEGIMFIEILIMNIYDFLGGESVFFFYLLMKFVIFDIVVLVLRYYSVIVDV